MGVGGCWAQSVKEEVFERFPFVDVAFGPGQVHKLAEFLTSESLSAQGYFEFEGFTGHLPARRERPFQGWVQISVGCNCRCSYCIVPSTRGREVTRPPEELVAEVRGMAGDGVKEVTLLGQNVNSYGRDLRVDGAHAASPSCSRTIDAIAGIERVRYTSPHPKDMREDVIRAHAELSSVCEHIHLPLQSGSSRVLKAMRRTYDRERYLDRVAMIREHVPDAALTTDIIVGFPGRPRRTSADTRGGRRRSATTAPSPSSFHRAGAPRLPRWRTPRPPSDEGGADGAARGGCSAARGRARPALRRSRARGARRRGPSRTAPEKLRGRTRHNKVVNFAGLASPGELASVRIDGATSQTLSGEELLLARAAD